jgi:hypothetical protein
MAIKLLTLVDPWERGESAKLGPEGAQLVEQALGTKGTLLRVWDAPTESAVSQFLVVQDPPRLNLIADAIESAGLHLDAVMPIVPSAMGGNWARTEADIIASLTDALPETLAQPTEDPLAMSPLPILGLLACTVCGGVGGHIYTHA